MMFEREAETMPRAQLAALQLERLRAVVGRLMEKVAFYRDHLGAAGITAESISSLDDLARLPFTCKGDLRDNYPFGLFAVPRPQVMRLHASSGTKGKPSVVGYTAADIDLWARCCARCLVCAGARPGDIVHNAYGYGLFTGGLGLHYGAERLGCTVVPASGGNTPRQAQLLEDLGAEILCCTPSYALAIADHVSEPERLELRAGVFGAEPWTEGLREAIEAALGLTALDIYGLSEVMGPGVSAECAEGHDGAHVNEDHFLVEVVDPQSGQPLPEGEVGELVFSTLTKEALPLLRYRTGDLASLTSEPCACGRTFARMSRVVGRTDDMLIIRGVNVFPSEIERALLAIPELAPHYQLVVERPGHLDELTVQVEGTTASDAVREQLQSVLGLKARVEVVPPGSVPRS